MPLQQIHICSHQRSRTTHCLTDSCLYKGFLKEIKIQIHAFKASPRTKMPQVCPIKGSHSKNDTIETYLTRVSCNKWRNRYVSFKGLVQKMTQQKYALQGLLQQMTQQIRVFQESRTKNDTTEICLTRVSFNKWGKDTCLSRSRTKNDATETCFTRVLFTITNVATNTCFTSSLSINYAASTCQTVVSYNKWRYRSF